MTQQTATIGRTEQVSFPHLHINDVPAKIDTGADASSVWASGIVEHDGKVSFVLFDETSRFFTGERITSSEYTVVDVRNSFGRSERRYKVPISVVIAGKRIRGKFNLADRSRNRYPILIGNSTIRNKFLIDVGAERAGSKRAASRILILSSQANSPLANKLLQGVKQQAGKQTDIALGDYSNIVFKSVGPKLHVTDLISGREVTDFDLIYFRTYVKKAELAAAVAEYLQARRKLFVDREVATYHATSKLTQYVKLKLAGLPVPDFIFGSHNYLSSHYDEIVQSLGTPFILKDAEAEKGQNNHLVHSQAELIQFLAGNPEALYIAQRYVQNNGDLRVLVFDKSVALVMGRKAATGTHLNNTSAGGTAELLPVKQLDRAVTAMCIRAAAITNRQVAGVDIIFDESARKWYILEVNNSPQISSGKFVDEKIAEFGKFLVQYSKR